MFSIFLYFAIPKQVLNHTKGLFKISAWLCSPYFHIASKQINCGIPIFPLSSLASLDISGCPCYVWQQLLNCDLPAQ